MLMDSLKVLLVLKEHKVLKGLLAQTDFLRELKEHKEHKALKELRV